MFATKKRIAGTEGTGDYVVIGTTNLGVLAVRLIGGFGGSTYRVRLEPSGEESVAALAKHLPPHQFPSAGWKQPGEDGQFRFSTVVTGGKALHSAVEQAVTALRQDGDFDDEWEGALNAVAMVGTTNRSQLIDRVRAARLPGSNGAGNWMTTTLLAKLIVAESPEGERDALISRLRGAKDKGANLAVTWSLQTLRRRSLFL